MGGLLRADSWNVPLNGCGGAAQLRLLRQDTPSALFLSQALAREGSTSSGHGQPQKHNAGETSERVVSNNNVSGMERGGSFSNLLANTASGLARANSIGSPLSQFARTHSGLSALALPGVASALQDEDCLGSPAACPSPGFASSLHAAVSPIKMSSPYLKREPGSAGKSLGGQSHASPSPVAKRMASAQRFDDGSGCLSPVLIHRMCSHARPSSPASANIWSPGRERQSPLQRQMKTASLSLSDSALHEPETDSAESLTDSFQASQRERSELQNGAESTQRPSSMANSTVSLTKGSSPLGLKSKQGSRLACMESFISGDRSRSSKKRSSTAESSDGVAKPHSGLGRKKLARKPCVNCGTTDTPQWRQGVNGVRNLCNACGVRFRKGQLDHLYKLASAGK